MKTTRRSATIDSIIFIGLATLFTVSAAVFYEIKKDREPMADDYVTVASLEVNGHTTNSSVTKTLAYNHFSDSTNLIQQQHKPRELNLVNTTAKTQTRHLPL